MDITSKIFNFQNYREFLKDRYHQLKNADPSFSFRSFSKDAGFGSPNYLKLVMDDKRNLSDEAVGKFAKGLRLNQYETEYFRYLVAHNQCEQSQKKVVYEAKLSYLKQLFEVKDLAPELYEYYHDWYNAAILEMIRKGAMANVPAEIGKKLVPTVPADAVVKAIEILKKLGLVQQNNAGELIITGKSEAGESAMAQKIYQEQMAELATQSIFTQPEDHGFESVTLSLSDGQITELKSRIHNWLKEMQGTDSQQMADAVYQLNVQFFALTKTAQRKKDTESFKI